MNWRDASSWALFGLVMLFVSVMVYDLVQAVKGRYGKKK